MTIVDVVLHKWRMLDDRRRRIFLGLTILTILLVVLLIYLATSGTKDTPTPQPPVPTTTLEPETTTLKPTTTPSPLPPIVLVASDDGKALAGLVGELQIGDGADAKTIDLKKLTSIHVEPEGKPEENRFKVSLKGEADNLEIVCNFVKNDKTIEADHITVSWNNGQGEKQCSLLHKGDNENFFHSQPADHYKCLKKNIYECTAGETKEASLIVDNIELEIDRKEPVDRANMVFETPPFECPS